MPKAAQPDLAEFKQLGRRQQRKPCTVAEAVARIPSEHQARVLAALEHDDEDIRRGAKRWMENRKVEPPNATALAHHRRKTCACHDC